MGHSCILIVLIPCTKTDFALRIGILYLELFYHTDDSSLTYTDKYEFDVFVSLSSGTLNTFVGDEESHVLGV
jgi:hypothetical protein